MIIMITIMFTIIMIYDYVTIIVKSYLFALAIEKTLQSGANILKYWSKTLLSYNQSVNCTCNV